MNLKATMPSVMLKEIVRERAAGSSAPAGSPRTIVACMHSRRKRPDGGALITLLVHPTEDAKFPAADVGIVTVTW